MVWYASRWQNRVSQCQVEICDCDWNPQFALLSLVVVEEEVKDLKDGGDRLPNNNRTSARSRRGSYDALWNGKGRLELPRSSFLCLNGTIPYLMEKGMRYGDTSSVYVTLKSRERSAIRSLLICLGYFKLPDSVTIIVLIDGVHIQYRLQSSFAPLTSSIKAGKAADASPILLPGHRPANTCSIIK